MAGANIYFVLGVGWGVFFLSANGWYLTKLFHSVNLDTNGEVRRPNSIQCELRWKPTENRIS